MESLGVKEIEISRLKLPGDMKKRQKGDNVKGLLTSIDSTGMLQFPVVRGSDRKLLAGGDRVAALMVRGETSVVVHLVECDDLEAEQITYEENIRRRHDPERNARELERLMAIYGARSAKDGEGPAKGAKRSGRERIAALRGVKPESVRKAEQRHRERINKKDSKQQREDNFKAGKGSPPLKESPILDLGFEMEPEWLASVAKVKGLLNTASFRLSSALGVLTQLEGLPVSEQRINRLKEEVKALGDIARALIPKSLCPYCKGQEDLIDSCSACLGTSYITEEQMSMVPAELWDTETHQVMRGGQIEALDVGDEDSLDDW